MYDYSIKENMAKNAIRLVWLPNLEQEKELTILRTHIVVGG